MRRRMLIVLLSNSGVASSRIRGEGLSRGLLDHGRSVDVLNADTRTWLLAAVLKTSIRRYDAVILQKLTPPPAICRLLYKRSRQAVYELDDAVYLGYPSDTRRSARRRARRVNRAV